MKPISALAVAALMLAAAACSKSSSESSAADDTTATAEAVVEAQPVSIVTWKEIGVRETPSEKGKYVTSIYLGEHIVATGDTASEKAGAKRNHYHKVTLTDGKSGWVRDEFIAIDVFPAVIITEVAQIMKRPDAATVTDKSFQLGDFVVVKKKDGDFIEVTGKSLGDKWYTTGYVRSENLTYADVEVQYATIKLRAQEETKENIKEALLSQLRDATLFGNSMQYAFDNPEAIEGDGEGEDGPGNTPFDITPPTEGLVGYYKLNSFQFTDASGLDHHGSEHGDVSMDFDVNRYSEGAINFDGNSWVSIPASSDKLSVPFTIIAYLNLGDAALPNQVIASRGVTQDGAGFAFGINYQNGSQVLYLNILGSDPMSISTTTSIESGQWVYVACTFDMDEARIYVNGEQAFSKPITNSESMPALNTLSDSAEPLEIGREAATKRYLKGSLDNVAVWTRALTAEEIASMSIGY